MDMVFLAVPCGHDLPHDMFCRLVDDDYHGYLREEESKMRTHKASPKVCSIIILCLCEN